MSELNAVDKTLFALEDIYECEKTNIKHNMVDIKVEGDESFTLSNGTVSHNSAMGFFLKVRNPDTCGAYPLRGVVMNTWDMTPAEVLKNKELSELVAILGVDINDPMSYNNMNYENVTILTDADVDGNHIASLLIAFFYRFWPEMVDEGRVSITRTPILISSNGKDEKWFYEYSEANKFKASCSQNYSHRYIKGLASHTEEEYSRIINEPKLDVIAVDDPSKFEIMFGKDASLRKEWLV
jgi:DNA gyrase/topoisomerase IV subunit B